MTTTSISSDDSLLVVSPMLALLTAVLLLAVEILTRSGALDAIRNRMTSTEPERLELDQLRRSISSLRLRSNQLNSPATFAEYSKVQRVLQREMKRVQQLQAEIQRREMQLGPMRQLLLTKGPKIGVYLVCLLVGLGRTIYVVPTTSGWVRILSYTPLRLVLGEVGIIPWIAICSTTVQAIGTWV